MDIRSLRVQDQHAPIEYTVFNAALSFTLWLEFEWWEPYPGDVPEINFFNMQISLSDGREYALNVWTYQYLNVARQDDCVTGENLHGAYLLPPDLFVTTLERVHIAAVITDLIEHHRLNEQWRVQQDSTADERDDSVQEEPMEDPIFARFFARARTESRITERQQGENAE